MHMQNGCIKFIHRDEIVEILAKSWSACFSPEALLFKNLGRALGIEQISDFYIVQFVLLIHYFLVFCLQEGKI